MSGHIVVGYTATKAGRDAVAFAARLASATDAVLDVAIILPSPDRSVITPPAAGYDRVLRDQAQHWIAEAIDRTPADVVAHSHVRWAESFAEGLVELADELGAAYLVVGAADGSSRGRHSLGSTTSELLHSSDVPVVLVPRGARKIAPETGVTRITVAVGTRPGADALITATAALADAAGVPVRLLSLLPVDLPPTPQPSASPEPTGPKRCSRRLAPSFPKGSRRMSSSPPATRSRRPCRTSTGSPAKSSWSGRAGSPSRGACSSARRQRRCCARSPSR